MAEKIGLLQGFSPVPALGMESALPVAGNDGFAVIPRMREVAIRTLGVSLVLVAAVAASLSLSRLRADPRALLASPGSEGAQAAPDRHLQAIRAAGL